jgi:uncharacterized protein (TIGR02453 family)
MKQIFAFLKKLKSNNNRDWFENHKNDYLKAREEYEMFIEDLLPQIKKFDKKIDKSLSAKECLFRIYKDVRFSKDKTPYKTNMGASINPGGKKSPVAGYYVHIEPGNSFVAGGVWMPEPALLAAIRQEIDYNAKPLTDILKSASFRKWFKGLDEEDKLKSAPKGFDKDHEHIELLKNRHFLVSHVFSDKDVLQAGFKNKVLDSLKAMYPLMVYLREAAGEEEA